MAFLRLLYLLIAGAAAVEPDGHFNPALCRYALGMEDGTIRDEDIVATSSWSDSTAAKHGRLSLGNGDGAWCPSGPVYPNNAEFLQVDLRRLHFITLVATQGRHANGHGNEFARAYRLVYSRNRRTWITWRDRWNNDVVSGNVNTYDIVLKDLGPPIIARYVRFYPTADRVMSVCLRVELYGCEWTDGLKAYTSPISHVMNLPGGPVYLNDSTYDGNIDAGLQYGGLGQLSDGVLGLDDFTEARELRVWPGYDYVGWNREAAGVGFVEMEFEFQGRRTFQSMQVHCNNRYQQAVKIFRGVSCLFKPDLLRQWNPEPVSLEVEADVRDPSARTVPVPLHGRSGQMVRCKFYFSDSWLLISEISFITDIGGENLSEEEPSNPAPAAPSVMPSTSPKVEIPSPVANTPTSRTTLGGQGRMPGMGDMTLNSTMEEEDWAMLTPKAGLPVAKDDNSHTSILVGCLVAIILLLLVVIVIILWRQYWKKILGKAQRRISDDDLRVHLSVPNDTVVINNTQNPLSAARYASRYERIQSCEGEQGPSFGGEYQEPSTLLRLRPESVLTTDSSVYGAGYMEPELLKAPPPYGFPSRAPPPCMAPSSYSVPHYAEADIINLQGVTGNNTYAVPAVTVDALASKDIGAGEFPREHLVFKEKLGEGQFGEVHLCEIDSPQDLVSLEFPFNIRKGRPLLVAVKILRSDATKNARNDFLKEVKILSRLKDPNIIRLLGVCVRDDPLCMITEYMESGDLNQFLSQRQLQDKASSASSMPTISYMALISMTSQIASGMKYLASLNFVHRDLATRNCLVGEGDTIKIADFGMSRSLYTSDYYRIQGRAVLPIRWMAWECILMGKFTTASDVWAFGVTLWEMLLLCKEQPYNWLTDEQVIENAGEFFRDQGKQIYLPRPEICPQGLFDLMLRCWSRDFKDRPSFVQIQRFLLEEAMNMV
ncbi:epithelial discoidin domain-containing receptor 1-like isoform X2 [Polyodon spathula]|uniref:epithelial discoidin domain-containing receptor 1-like isoform X2 n=1 Tax=Polyodon spathula TaxID=7913 RepID=UPI001B7DE9A2|nr:epithelial discoidin domain-containing receptor 1-like isoform X2 [Polyodon spathula]